ncbi:tetracycline resistance protein, class C-like [Teleopsis dalmanni]|uniref:tetracycline resistance protein, class C-like n=1 Tax=Teleopsis dalmanni TaxID=139649 RepID=UPI0018CEC0DF|nr:tetracycline resistance protein, class C-like [Teleopsis dalmanni]
MLAEIALNTLEEPQAQQLAENVDQSLTDKIKLIFRNITVEPILACYIMPSVLSSLATQNLNLEKACRVNMDYGDTVCDALTRRETANYTLEEETVQQMVAHMAAWKTVIQSLFPCLLILFWGSWSDRHHRRKPCILIPIVGEFIGIVGLMFCVYFERTPMEVVAMTEAIAPSLSGGWFTMLMGVFSYIADITTEEERTLRVGILNVCFSMGVPIGMAFSGVLLTKIGFYGIFSISATMYVISFIYGFFYLTEPRLNKNLDQCEHKSILCDFFNKKHIVQTFKVAFQKGENYRRKRVILIMIVVMIVIGPLHGELTVTYLFSRFRFNWNEVDFSIYSTVAMVLGLAGVVFCVGVLSHKFNIDDALIGVLSCLSKIFGGFVYAFATQPWHMYMGGFVEMFNGTSFIAMRSIATKLVNKDELGKVNSLFGVAEALMPMVFGPMYTTLYAATITILPGAFYLLGSGLTVFAVLIFFWMYYFQCQLNLLKENSTEGATRESENVNTRSDMNTIEVYVINNEENDRIHSVDTNANHENSENTVKTIYKQEQQLKGTDNVAFVSDTGEHYF